MAEIPMFLRYSPVFLLAAGLSACSHNAIDSSILLAAANAKTAALTKSPVKDRKIMTPSQVSLMIKSLMADVANSKKIAGSKTAAAVK